MTGRVDFWHTHHASKALGVTVFEIYAKKTFFAYVNVLKYNIFHEISCHSCINTIFRYIKHEKSRLMTDNRWYIFEYITKLQYTCQFDEKCDNPSCQIRKQTSWNRQKLYKNSEIVHCQSLDIMDISILSLIKPTFTVMSV